MPKPRVLVADDHVILAQGLMVLLQDDFEVVGLARDGRDLVEFAKQSKPDVIVTDISMPLLNGMDAVRQLRSEIFAEGKTAKEVASSLNLSVRTAEGHKYEIMEALGAKTSAELVQHAIRLGLISV